MSEVPKSITITVWEPTAKETAAARRLFTTVNSNKARGPARATIIETPYPPGGSRS